MVADSRIWRDGVVETAGPFPTWDDAMAWANRVARHCSTSADRPHVVIRDGAVYVEVRWRPVRPRLFAAAEEAAAP